MTTLYLSARAIWPFNIRLILLVLTACVLAGCASSPQRKAQTLTAYNIRALTRVEPEHPEVSRKLAQTLVKVEGGVEMVADIHVDSFLLLDRYQVNAAATVIDGKRILLVNTGILRLLKDDPDALAALFGHEIAHLKLEHGDSRKGLNRAVGIGTQTLGLVASLFIPGGGYLVNMGGNALTKAYSRDQEREADKLGLEYAVQAGYEPAGMLRMLNALPVASGSDGSSGFFDSHPGKKERIGYIEALILERYGGQVDRPAATVPQAQPVN